MSIDPLKKPFTIEERMWEWLTLRLDRQDQLLSDILRESRKTNGTLRDHESRLRVIERDEDEQQAEEQKEEERVQHKADQRSRRREWIIGSICVLLGGSLVQPFAHLMKVMFG